MILLLSALALAAPRQLPVTWTQGGTSFAGTLVWDDASAAPRPAVLYVPNWMGPNAAAVEKAQRIAGTQYVVLVADMYGKDVRPTTPDQARDAAGKVYADRAGMRARANAALDALRGQAKAAPIDPARVAAIGFCFGGSTVLELARSGADVDAVVSFHGGLTTPVPAEKGKVKASVLALSGAADPYQKPEDVPAFQKEMTDAGADWALVNYGGAVHCFAEPDANMPPGCAYDEKAAKRAFRAMDDFLAEAWAR